MTDPISLRSTTAPHTIEQHVTTQAEKKQERQTDGFEDYLKTSSVKTEEKQTRKPNFDPAAEITAQSIYKPPL